VQERKRNRVVVCHSSFLLLDSRSGTRHLLVLILIISLSTLELGRSLGSTLGDATGLDSCMRISVCKEKKKQKRGGGTYSQE